LELDVYRDDSGVIGPRPGRMLQPKFREPPFHAFGRIGHIGLIV
jgi:hypothetical protein